MKILICYYSLDNHKIGNLLAEAYFYDDFSVAGRHSVYAVSMLHIFYNINFWQDHRFTYVKSELAYIQDLNPDWYNPQWNNPCSYTFDNQHLKDWFFVDWEGQHKHKIFYLFQCACIYDNNICNVLIKISVSLDFLQYFGIARRGKMIDILVDSFLYLYADLL